MSEKQTLHNIFGGLFKLFDKYGDDIILYCYSEHANKIACDMSINSKLQPEEINLLNNVKNILQQNHFDKLNQLKISYEKYKKTGDGHIKFAHTNGTKTIIKIDDIVKNNPISGIVEPALRFTDITTDFDRTTGKTDNNDKSDSDVFAELSDDSMDLDDLSETSQWGGKKTRNAKRAKKAKKEKKEAKRKLKDTAIAHDARKSKKKAKNAKKAMYETPEGKHALEAKRKVKHLKKSNASATEIHEAKEYARKTKHEMKLTREGRRAEIAHKRAQSIYSKLHETPEAQEYKQKKQIAREAKQLARDESENILPFLEKMFGQTVAQTNKLTDLLNTSVEKDNKIIALLEQINNGLTPTNTELAKM